MSILEPEAFKSRHIGPDTADTAQMLNAIGAASIDALIDEAIPARIRQAEALRLPPGVPEHEFLRALRVTASRNSLFKSYIGLGYYDCVTPSVILRNVLENPGWYTPYTPYQAEIARTLARLVFNREGGSISVEIARQGGKNELSAQVELLTLLASASRGGTLVKCAPTYLQAGISKERLRRRARAADQVQRQRARFSLGHRHHHRSRSRG